VETSDEESDFEVELDTSSSDEEDSRPRLARLLSPPSESVSLSSKLKLIVLTLLDVLLQERVLTPPRNCHPAELEVLEPPKKKFSRRGRPPKSPRSGKTSLRLLKTFENEIIRSHRSVLKTKSSLLTYSRIEHEFEEDEAPS